MVREFISYYKPHKFLLIIDLICTFLISATDLIFPMVTRSFINQYIPNRDIRRIWIFALILLLLYIIRLILDYIVGYWGHILGVRMEYDMRRDMFRHLQTQSFKFFDDNKTGQLMSRLVNDLNEISELAHHGPEDVFISAVMLLGSFILLLRINISLTLIVFAIVPFLVWFTIQCSLRMRKSFRDLRESLGDINSRIEDSMTGIRVVKSFTNEPFEEVRFDYGNAMFKKLRGKSVRYLGIFNGGVNFFSNLLNLTALTMGGYFVYLGKMDIADMTAFILFMGLMISPVKRIATFIELFQRGMAGFRRFSDVMKIKPEIVDKEGASLLSDVKGRVEFINASFKYAEDKEEVLNNINLSIKEGETIAIVGPSGAGKSTLCSLVPRFYELTSGRIEIDGINIKDVTLRSLRENIGIVQQDVFLFDGSIYENILYGNLNASREEVIEASKKANAHDFIMESPNGYETNIGERGVKLSGGQKQRISIARMFLKNPKILILDEATSSLDNKSERIIQESIEELAKNRTTFIIAHRLATIRNAKRIIVLTENGIEEEGSHEELLAKKGVYFNLYNTQF